jgi:hypothetical protein
MLHERIRDDMGYGLNLLDIGLCKCCAIGGAIDDIYGNEMSCVIVCVNATWKHREYDIWCDELNLRVV